MSWSLKALSSGTEVDIVHGFSVGRHERNHLVLIDDSISRKHARFDMHQGRLWVKDLESANGVYVNAERVREVEVFSGDRIQIGEILFVVCKVGVDSMTVIKEVGPQFQTSSKASLTEMKWEPSGWRTLAGQLFKKLSFLKATSLIVHVDEINSKSVCDSFIEGPAVEMSSWLLEEARQSPLMVSESELLKNRASLIQRNISSLLVWPLYKGVFLWAESESQKWSDREFEKVKKILESFLPVFQTALQMYASKPALTPFIADDFKTKEVISQARKVAMSSAPVLISGLAGTGKTLLANWLHEWSSRRDEPCIRLDLAMIPKDLIGSTLFGHAQGAFTGADKNRSGVFEEAHRGTLVLENIDECPIDTQVMLLRVLEDNEVTPLGSMDKKKVDVRIIATSKSNLEDLSNQGFFRHDLYYRIAAISLTLPSLDEREGDFSSLVISLADDLAQQLGRGQISFEKGFLAKCRSRMWPGNIRELKNLLERSFVMSDLKGELMWPEKDVVDQTFPTLKDLEKEHVLKALGRVNWNKGEACELLGITRPTLAKKIEDYGLEKPL